MYERYFKAIIDKLSGGSSINGTVNTLTDVNDSGPITTLVNNSTNKATETTLAALLDKFTGTQTLSSSLATTSGSVAAGAFSIGMFCSADFVGTINGVNRSGETYLSVTADVGKTLGAISYTITAGSITIDRLV